MMISRNDNYIFLVFLLIYHNSYIVINLLLYKFLQHQYNHLIYHYNYYFLIIIYLFILNNIQIIINFLKINYIIIFMNEIKNNVY